MSPNHAFARLFVVCLVVGLSCGCAVFGSVLSSNTAERPEESVVHIFYVNPDSPETRQPSGTGFVVSDTGVIATAAHVVESEGLIDVKFSKIDGTDAVYMPARLITLDRERDVALLQVDLAHSGLRVAPLSYDGMPEIGDGIAIYGFPESEVVGFEMRRSSGTISALRANPLDRSDHHTRMLELEAKIEPGNSGSPVFNNSGDVIGVVSSRWKTTDSYALAAPIHVVFDLLDKRYPTDLKRLTSEIATIPSDFMVEVEHAQELAKSMRTLFPQGSEGERLVAQLEFCMDRAVVQGQLGMEALERGSTVEAWRHLQILRYEAQSHQQDIAFLRSTHRTLEASRAGVH